MLSAIKKSMLTAIVFVLTGALAVSATEVQDQPPTSPAPEIEQAMVTLSGVVVDAQTRAPIGNVEIQIPVSGQSTTTDSNGNFTFENMNPGKYQVKVKYQGYKEYSQTVEIRQNEKNKKLVIKLQPKS